MSINILVSRWLYGRKSFRRGCYFCVGKRIFNWYSSPMVLRVFLFTIPASLFQKIVFVFEKDAAVFMRTFAKWHDFTFGVYFFSLKWIVFFRIFFIQSLCTVSFEPEWVSQIRTQWFDCEVLEGTTLLLRSSDDGNFCGIISHIHIETMSLLAVLILKSFRLKEW